jgi:hypothetical protein
MRILHSPRMRRRLLWLSVAGVAAAAVVVAALLIPNQKETFTTPPPASAPNRPVQLAESVKEVRLTARDRREISRTIDRFVVDVVGRRNVGAGYDLVTRTLTEGQTRAQWARSVPPTLPYRALGRHFGWTLDYALAGDVTANVVLKPARGNRQGAYIFSAELKRFGQHWRMDAFVPVAQFGQLKGTKRLVAAPDFTPQGLNGKEVRKGRISSAWLAIPVVALGLALLVPLGMGVRSRRAAKRAEREFAQAFGR